MANLQIVISALNKASGDLSKVKKDLEGVGSSGKKAEGGVDGFFKKIQGGIATAALAAGVIASVGLAVKQDYDDMKEGAELEYARTRFDNLAASVGTVSDALLGDLRAATRGMMSDSELVAGAADFMALGLAKSHDEVVRLTAVAGALGMNMNQLVLTLTNQTTMRFDALGVSVDGFKEKVKSLEAAGMSAEEAFTEAFLQQAEAQIEKVGNKADTSAGQIQTMESAFKNLSDAIKLGLANSLDEVTPKLTEAANTMTENVTIGGQMTDTMDSLKNAYKAGLITTAQYDKVLSETNYFWKWGAFTADDLRIAQDALNSATKAGTDGVVTYTEAIAMGKAQLAGLTMATEQVSVETLVATGDFEGLATSLGITTEEAKAMIKAWQDSETAFAKMKAQMEDVTSMRGNYSGIIGLAYKYTDALKDIIEQETIMANNPIGSEKYEEAKDKVNELKDKMAELANQVTLDMFQATIAINGVTEAEFGAYMQMAIDMGMMSEEGAQAAIEAYGRAIHTINGYEINEKTLNVKFEVDDSSVRNYNPPTKYGTVAYIPNQGANQAVGGAVNAGNPYNWQEYGYRGEVFVPSADGFVLSRADAERALAKALYGGGSAISPEEIGKAVASAMSGVTSSKKGGNVYNLTMPTSSNPVDVRTAFELMEAWA